MAYDDKDYILNMLAALETEVCNRIQGLRDKVNCLDEPEPEVHDIRVYSPQTPEEFERMERNNRR